MMKDKISMFVFTIVLGSILTVTLVAVESCTAPMIKRNGELKRKSSILQALEIPYDRDTIEQVFLDSVRGRGTGDEKYYIVEDGRLAFLFRGAGLWGPIEGVLAMDGDMRNIKRVEIVHQEETPGLGGRIAEREFLERFNEKVFVPALDLVPEGKASSENEIDSITGATISSEAFVGILNAGYEKFSVIISGE
ncbi:MAG: FMN-binding protein [bacterium]|nr:FMN-binding protein [bacterium]